MAESCRHPNCERHGKSPCEGIGCDGRPTVADGPWCSEDAVIVQAIVGLPMRLKAHRSATGRSQREVARLCGVSFSTVCRVERGEDYTVDNLLALAAYLDGEAHRG